MRKTKTTLTAGLVFFLILVIFGISPESSAQSPRQDLRGRLQSAGFITLQPLPSWGTIIGSKGEAVNLSAGEIVYIRLHPGKELKAGDRFTVVHQGEAITHPLTKAEIGHLTVFPGKLVILDRQDQMATGKISGSSRPILLGDYITTPGPVAPKTLPIRAVQQIEGRVILSQEDIENITFNEWVIIDRGSRDGVVPGTLFKIYQKGLGPEAPREKIGEASVVSVQQETSAALITLSKKEIPVGAQAVSGPE